MNKRYLKKQYLKLIDEVAIIDKDAALYLAKIPSFSKKKRLKLDFEFCGDLDNVMVWNQTKQGCNYWADISDQLT